MAVRNDDRLIPRSGVSVIDPRPALAPDLQTDARGGAYRAARRHSSRVRLLKVAIPLGALVAVAGVAAATFWSPFSQIPGLTVGPISLAGAQVKMEGPRLTGFRQDARPYEVTATAAFQDIRRPNVIELKDMRARLAVDASGSMATLVSKGGLFDTTKEQLELKDEIRISTEKGDEALLTSASVDFKAGTVVSREPIRVTTSQLVLQADAFQLSDGGGTMSFIGRVRTQLLPAPSGPGAAVGRSAAPAATPAAKVLQAEAGERR